jgi:hypothetical protein
MVRREILVMIIIRMGEDKMRSRGFRGWHFAGERWNNFA